MIYRFVILVLVTALSVGCSRGIYKKKVHGGYKVSIITQSNSLAYPIVQIKGHVWDKETNKVIEGCAVSIKGTKKGTFTDRNGAFNLKIKEGKYRFIAANVRNTTIETRSLLVREGTSVEISFYLGNSKIYEK